MARWIAPVVAIGLLAVAACSRPEPAQPETAQVPTPAPVTGEPAAEPVPAPGEAAPTVAKNDPAVIHFEGFGPAKFGADEEQVRMAWGRELKAGTPSEGATCYYLVPDPPSPDGYGMAFMFEEGGFRRYDVDSPRYVAPGDLTVGARAEDVLVAFAGRVGEQPHKYVEGGRYLVVSPEQGGESRLVFVVDAQGVVTDWRIGVLPQVLYVEGCS